MASTGEFDIGSGSSGNAGKFSGKNVSLSIESFSINSPIYISCNPAFDMEFMCNLPFQFPTWTTLGGQDDIAWINVSAGNWDRGGVHYIYASAHTHTSGSVDDEMNTHIYLRDTLYGNIKYYPRIVIKYDPNGGSAIPVPQEKYIGTAINLADDIIRNHYQFLGWSTSSSATSASYSAGKYLNTQSWNSLYSSYLTNNGWQEYMPAHNGNTVTLYAVWKGNTYTVSYNANGGSSTPAAQSSIYPNPITLASAISRDNGSTTGYLITYNSNGGSSAPNNQTSGNRVVMYIFDKWASGSPTGAKYLAGDSFTPTANTTMYATWSSTISANSSWTCSNVIPTKENCTFLGWSTSATATTATYKPGETYNITSALNLYAVWEENQAEIGIKQNNTWKSGKMYIKKNGQWVKAKAVYIKKNGQWVNQ